MTFRLTISILLLMTFTLSAEERESTEFSHLWDSHKPLKNPHKGWYHHYYDNGLHKYLARDESKLLKVPGLDHLYLRFGWSYLEPREGDFQWHIIDDVIEKWSPKGLGFSLRISCKETGAVPHEQKFATPQWVQKAGAKGGFYFKGKEASGNDNFPWEPVYDDPVYLKKLENMLKALATRYDGHPQLRYIDIGSIGDWGEGHTSSGSRNAVSAATSLKHLELHRKYFKKTPIIATDDFLSWPTPEGTPSLDDYAIQHHLGVRDDSIFVNYWFKKHPETFSVSRPELFKQASLHAPTILETQHLHLIFRHGNWKPQPNSALARHKTTGSQLLTEATKLLRATYLGYHGDAGKWLSLPENPQLSQNLLNLCGYWYFPHSLEKPNTFSLSHPNEIEIVWENRGLAPAYNSYEIAFRLEGLSDDLHLPAHNRTWAPGKLKKETYALDLSKSLGAGTYQFSFRLFCPILKRPIHLPLAKASSDGFVNLGSVIVHH